MSLFTKTPPEMIRWPAAGTLIETELIVCGVDVAGETVMPPLVESDDAQTWGSALFRAVKLELTALALIVVPAVKVVRLTAAAKPRDDARTAMLIHWLRDSLKMFFLDSMISLSNEDTPNVR